MQNAQSQFETILASLDAKSRSEFCQWVRCRVLSDQKSSSNSKLARKKLGLIAKRLRELTPLEYCLETNGGCPSPTKERKMEEKIDTNERLMWPSKGPFADCKPHNTLHVDAFLFDDADLENMTQDGILQRHFCRRCHSNDVMSANLISHSLSIDELHHLFTVLLPSLDIQLDGKILVDLGSRLGAVLYAAALFCPQLGRIIGIERLAEFDSLQRQILAEFGCFEKVELCCADFRDRLQLFSEADIVVMHNVFAFFADETEQIDCWQRLRFNLRPGTLLLHSPSVESATEHLALNFVIKDWLETLHDIKDDDGETADTIAVYRVRSDS